MREILPIAVSKLILFNFVLGNYEENVDFLAEVPIYEDNNFDFTTHTTTLNTFSMRRVHTDPRNIQVSQLFSPEFTESDIAVPSLELDPIETEEQIQSVNQKTEFENSEGGVIDDFNHTKENWSEILSTKPKFNESEDIVDNINDEETPNRNVQEDSEQPFIFTDTEEEIPSDDIFKDVVDIEFTENEYVPDRIFNDDIGSIPTNEKNSEFDEDITYYKNPNSEYEKTKRVNLILEDDTEPEKITLEIPTINDALIVDNWEDKTDLGHNWYELEWFGTFYTAEEDFNGFGWIYHIKLEWIFISSKNYESVWIWSEQIGGWNWTSKTTFPYLFLHNTDNQGSWVFFDKEKQLFYNFANKKWIDSLKK